MAKNDEKNKPQEPVTPPAEPATPQEPVTPPAEPAAPSVTPNEDLFMENLGKKYPDLAGNREAIFGKSMEDYDKEHEYAKKGRKQADEIKGYFQADENVNNFFVDLMEWGPKGKAWKAFLNLRPIWRQYMNGELQDEEFEAALRDMEANYAEIERKKEMAANAFDAVCEERGWDPEETKVKLNDLIAKEVENEDEAKEQVRQMFRILEFDDAVAAAEIRGRNSKIKEEKRNHPAGADTLPRNGGSPAGGSAPTRSLLGQAADAAAKRRAEFES